MGNKLGLIKAYRFTLIKYLSKKINYQKYHFIILDLASNSVKNKNLHKANLRKNLDQIHNFAEIYF